MWHPFEIPLKWLLFKIIIRWFYWLSSKEVILSTCELKSATTLWWCQSHWICWSGLLLTLMQLSIITLAPHYPAIAGTCPGIQFCTLWRSRYSPGLQGTFFLVNPQVAPCPITPGTFGQRPSIYWWGRSRVRFPALMKEVPPSISPG